ncbi:MAG TPA: DegT/DnrJ/EryC1/StrS family aminotransferase [Candidatus Baltobacteraceae bacterium]|jgi:dTDP-4-amino-4,6-dideoxygalactose transaminase
MGNYEIPYWRTKLRAEERDAVASAVEQGCLSMGAITERFEAALADFFGVPSVVCTTSGSSALFLACAGLGLGPGDEVILPNRTFVATAHAVMLTGASVRLVDVRSDCTIIDEDQIAAAITPRTRAICAVHLNGNHADMERIRAIARKEGLAVFEDAAQAFASRSPQGYLGTLSDAGCFSLGVTKLITTGQGGLVIAHTPELAERLRRFRSHGVFDTFDATYERFGFNLKYTDMQASVGLVQLGRVSDKIERHKRFYSEYTDGLTSIPFIRMLEVDLAAGNVPLWAEALVADRENVIRLLAENGIQVRPFLPNLSEATHLSARDEDFPNSRPFARHGIFLPSGPDLPPNAVARTIEVLRSIAGKVHGEAPVLPPRRWAA